jgi:hypothetical protein
MSAIPVVPGFMYQVRFQGQLHIVFATNPVDALCIVLEQLGAV